MKGQGTSKIYGLVIVCLGVAALSYLGIMQLNSIKPGRIFLFLPKAYQFVYEDATAYKGAMDDTITNAIRDIDIRYPLPVNSKKIEQSMTLGVRNGNRKTVKDVVLFLELPPELQVTRPGSWVQYRDGTYYCPYGNINRGVRYSLEGSIYFKPLQKGIFDIKYTITGSNFNRASGTIPVEVY